jgi:hypothetical protein
MEGASSCSSSSSAAAAQGGRGGEVGIRVGATNIGRLRGAPAAPGRHQQQQGKQPQHGARGGGVTSWHLRAFAAAVGVMGCVLLAASLAMSALHQVQFRNAAISRNVRGLQVRTLALLRLLRIRSLDFEWPWWFLTLAMHLIALVVGSCPCSCAAAVPFVLSRLIPFFHSTTTVSNKSVVLEVFPTIPSSEFAVWSLRLTMTNWLW